VKIIKRLEISQKKIIYILSVVLEATLIFLKKEKRNAIIYLILKAVSRSISCLNYALYLKNLDDKEDFFL